MSINSNPYTVANHKKWTHQQWLDFRMDGIGGSDAAAIVGEHKYKTTLEIYLEKIGEYSKNIDNEAIRAGRKHEKDIIQMYQYWDHQNPEIMQMYKNQDNSRILQKVKQMPQTLIFKKWNVLRANLDSYIVATKDYPRGVLECKFRKKYEADRYSTGVSPADVLQIQHYLLVTGFSFGVIGLLVDGWDYRYAIYKADPELQKMLVDRYEEFWNRVMTARRIKAEYKIDTYYGRHESHFSDAQLAAIGQLQSLEPDFTGQEGELELLRHLMKPTPEETVMEGTPEQLEYAVGYKQIDKQIKILTKEKTRYQSQLQRTLNGTHRAEFGVRGYLSYKPDSRGVSKLYISPKLIPDDEEVVDATQ